MPAHGGVYPRAGQTTSETPAPGGVLFVPAAPRQRSSGSRQAAAGSVTPENHRPVGPRQLRAVLRRLLQQLELVHRGGAVAGRRTKVSLSNFSVRSADLRGLRRPHAPLDSPSSGGPPPSSPLGLS